MVGERHWEWYGTDSIFVKLGKSAVVEIAQPIDQGGRAAADMAGGGDVLHAVTLRVSDVGRLEQHLAAGGVKSARNGPDLVVDAADAQGALIRFTEHPAWS